MAFPFPITGIDATDGAVYAMVTQKKKNGARIHAKFALAIEKGTDEIDEDATKRMEHFRAALRSVAEQKVPKHVIVALDDSQTFLFTVRLQERAATDIAEAVRWEAGQHLPYELEQVILDWRVVRRENGTVTVQVAAVAKDVVDAYIDACSAAKLIPIGVVPAALAALTPLTFEDGAEQIVVHIRRFSTTLSIVRDSAIPFSLNSPSFCATRVIRSLMQSLRLNEKEAVKALAVYGLDHGTGDTSVHDALASEFRFLVDNIKTLQDFSVRNNVTERQLKHGPIVVAGDGVYVRALPGALAASLHQDVIIASPPIGLFDETSATPLSESDFVEYQTALGLTLMNL